MRSKENLLLSNCKQFFALLFQYPQLITISRAAVTSEDFKNFSIYRDLYILVTELDKSGFSCSLENTLKYMSDKYTPEVASTLAEVIKVILSENNATNLDLDTKIFCDICQRLPVFSIIDEYNLILDEIESTSEEESYTKSVKQFNAAVGGAAKRLRRAATEERQHTSKILNNTIDSPESLESLLQNQITEPTLLYNIPSVDNKIGGFMPGDLTVIVATSGVGKSLFVDYIAQQAVLGKKSCLYVVLEMDYVKAERRFMDSLTQSRKVSNDNSIAGGSMLDPIKQNELLDMLRVQKEAGAYINVAQYNSNECSHTDIIELMELFLEQTGKYPDIVLIDGIPNMSNPYKEKKLEGEKENVVALDNLAKKYRIPVVATHQLNRQAYGADKLDASSISGSLDIYKTAAYVIGLRKFDVGDEQNPSREGELFFMKQRHTDDSGHNQVRFAQDLPNSKFYVHGTDYVVDIGGTRVEEVKEKTKKPKQDSKVDSFAPPPLGDEFRNDDNDFM